MTEPGLPASELLERERRWLKPAGIAAFAGAFLLMASIVATRVGLAATLRTVPADDHPAHVDRYGLAPGHHFG